MIRTSDETRTLLLRTFPALTHDRLDLEDRKWRYPTRAELEQALAVNSVTHLTFIPVVQECEEFSLHLMSRIRLWEAQQAEANPPDEYVNWAFGMCRGDLLKLTVTVHKRNVCCTEDSGVVVIEPQTNAVSVADHTKYSVWDITM